MNDWLGRDAASQLRLWPVLDDLVARLSSNSAYDAALLLGSLARGEGDDYSDIDLMLVVGDGRWDDAWPHRRELSGDALYAWDEFEATEKTKHAWLTREFVMVECSFTTTLGAHPLADPFVVIAGDPAAADRLPRLPPFTRERLQEIVDDLARQGKTNHVQGRYGDLVAALRAGARCPTQ